jgi:regulator of CtrA degradation
MNASTDITATIIEELYGQSLMLADDVRAAFDLATPREVGDDIVRIALSTEGLKTTTRIMHVLAWLLNQRAYFRGEMTAYQLERHGRLPPDRPPEDSQMALLEIPTQLLILETQVLHARVARLDRANREGDPSGIEGPTAMQARLRHAFGRH